MKALPRSTTDLCQEDLKEHTYQLTEKVINERKTLIACFKNLIMAYKIHHDFEIIQKLSVKDIANKRV